MNRNKNILVVVESIDIDNSSGSKANISLIQNLRDCGYHLKVYHYSKKEVFLSGIDCTLVHEKKFTLYFLLSRIERHLRLTLNLYIHRPLEELFGFSFTLFNDRNSIASALQTLNDFIPDLVLTLSQGSSFRPHHALLKLPGFHNKWMAYIHDPYPMHSYPRPYDYVEPGHQKKRNFFLRVSKEAKFAAYPSKLLAEWMESYYHDLKGKSVIIPHQIDAELKPDLELPDFFEKEKFNVVHAGALMSARNPMALARAFASFLEDNPEAKTKSQLLFIGGKSVFEEALTQMRKNVPQIFLSEGYLPFSTVFAIQKEASMNVIIEAKGPISPFLPGKFAHCVAANKPILLLGPYYSESKRLLGENYPFWCEIDDEEEIKKRIEASYNLWIENGNWTLSRTDLEHYLSREHLSKTMEKVLESLEDEN